VPPAKAQKAGSAMKHVPQQQHASVALGQVAAMLHGLNARNVPPSAAQYTLEVCTHPPVRQHAPGIVAGQTTCPQIVPTPIQSAPLSMQSQEVVMMQTPLGSQHAPNVAELHGGGHGFGLQVPPAVQLELGGAGQAAAVV